MRERGGFFFNKNGKGINCLFQSSHLIGSRAWGVGVGCRNTPAP